MFGSAPSALSDLAVSARALGVVWQCSGSALGVVWQCLGVLWENDPGLFCKPSPTASAYSLLLHSWAGLQECMYRVSQNSARRTIGGWAESSGTCEGSLTESLGSSPVRLPQTIIQLRCLASPPPLAPGSIFCSQLVNELSHFFLHLDAIQPVAPVP